METALNIHTVHDIGLVRGTVMPNKRLCLKTSRVSFQHPFYSYSIIMLQTCLTYFNIPSIHLGIFERSFSFIFNIPDHFHEIFIFNIPNFTNCPYYHFQHKRCLRPQISHFDPISVDLCRRLRKRCLEVGSTLKIEQLQHGLIYY